MGSVVSVFSCLMNNAWDMLVSTYIPGTSVAIGYALMGIVLAVFSVRVLCSAIGLQINPVGPGLRGLFREAKNNDNAAARRASRRSQGVND